MGNRFIHISALCLLGLATGCVEVAEVAQQKAPAAKPTVPKLPTHKVEKTPFKIDVVLKGVFEADQMTEVSLRPEVWTGDLRGALTVMKAIEHGTHVKKGDTLVWLDLEKIDQTIRDYQADQHLAELNIKQAEEELPVLEKSTPLDLAQAERAKTLADEDLKKFVDTDRPLAQKQVEFNLRSAANTLEYAKEELHQLEKMYRANDIREETEEIILKRQRNVVESSDFYLQSARIQRDIALKLDLPRQERALRDNSLRQTIALDKAKKTLPLQLSQKTLALAKMKYDQEKTVDRLHKLKKDRESFTVKAPADGVVYYGKCTRGQWTTTSAVAQRMVLGGVLSPDEVFITVLKPRPFFVRAVVEEKDLSHVRKCMTAKVAPSIDPDRKLPGRVDQVLTVPIATGQFEARIDLLADDPVLIPGMACTVHLIPYSKPDALAVPSSTVFKDDLDDEKHYVYLVKKDGQHAKHPVTVGKTVGTKTEILEGLSEGDQILLEKPPAEKKG